MSQLSVVAWGLLLVVVDLRIDGGDLVPDPVGWLMALVSLRSLGHVHRGFSLASMACVVGFAVSVPDWFLPGHAGVEFVVSLAETAVVFATCTAIIGTVPDKARAADLVRWWNLGLTVTVGLGIAAVASGGEDDLAALAPVLLLAGLAGLVVFVCFLVLLFRTSRFPAPADGATLAR